MDRVPDPWPFRGLVLRTPRLELRPDDDAGLLELNEAALAGVHPPEQMPFQVPWTDAPPEIQGRTTLQYYWGKRAALGPDDWSLQFLIRFEGKVVGSQELAAKDFSLTREVKTGSWLTQRVQGQGIGTEMRAAALMLAFDHLGATVARSGAFEDNLASRAVSRKLGYAEHGSAVRVRRGERAMETLLRLDRDRFVRPDWTVSVEGLEPCLPVLGL